MKLSRKFQEGGAMPQEQAAQDPTQILMQGAQQAVQNQDCQIALQVCQMLIEALGGGMQAQQQPAAPAPAEGEPVYKKGGRLLRRIKG